MFKVRHNIQRNINHNPFHLRVLLVLPLLLLLIHFFYSCCSNRASKPASGTPVTACPCLSHACLCVWGVCGVCGFLYLLSDLLTCCGLTHLQLALQRPESNHLNCNEMHDQRHHVEQIVAGHYAQLPHDRVGFPVGEGRCERDEKGYIATSNCHDLWWHGHVEGEKRVTSPSGSVLKAKA